MDSNKITSKTPRRLLLLFQILTLILLFVYKKDELTKDLLITGVGLIGIVYLSNIILSRISSGDHYIFLIATMLMSIGLIMIYRLQPEYGIKQLVWVSLGILCFYITYFLMKNIRFWQKLLPLYIGIAYMFFILTLGLATKTHGARNWISIAGIGFQPAEITKLLLIFILASYYSRRELSDMEYKSKLRLEDGGELTFKEKYSSYILMAIIYSFLALLFLQKDLGMALIFYGIFIVVQFIYEDDRKIVYINLGLFTMAGILGYYLFSHVRVRFDIWIDPWKYIDGTGYQITQSLFAIAEGGFFGKGLGMGHPQFIPLAYNDFIFPAIVEEMGIFTGIGIIMLYMILVYRGFKIAINQNNRFYKILAVGVSALFGVQAFVILGGVLKVIPLTGITLPFIAYGGTSILSSFIALGVLQVASEGIDWKVSDNEGK